MRNHRLPRAAQRGVTMLMVLILLSVMLLGGLAMARITEVGTLASGNSAFREASLQASEVGINSAFVAVKALSNEDAAVSNWYYPTMLTTDSAGLPSVSSWSSVPSITVGSYTVQYVVERMCSVSTITDTLRQCLIKLQPSKVTSNVNGRDELEPPNARQFRITVRVTGPKDTETWVQSLVSKG